MGFISKSQHDPGCRVDFPLDLPSFNLLSLKTDSVSELDTTQPRPRGREADPVPVVPHAPGLAPVSHTAFVRRAIGSQTHSMRASDAQRGALYVVRFHPRLAIRFDCGFANILKRNVSRQVLRYSRLLRNLQSCTPQLSTSTVLYSTCTCTIKYLYYQVPGPDL
jgi:hypothetical protein